jgi:hypothetical protein
MNVTAEEFAAYVELFHRTLENGATQYLPKDLKGSLFHLSSCRAACAPTFLLNLVWPGSTFRRHRELM